MAGRSKRLGEILIDHGVLTEENLKKALELQKQKAGLIGEILVENGFVKEEELVVALAEQFGYPYLPVSSFVINQDAPKAVPAELAVEYLCVPVDKIGRTLAVVMADPSNKTAIQRIERATGCKLRAFVGTVSEIEDALARVYPAKELESKSKKMGERMRLVLRRVSAERAGRRALSRF